MSLLSTASPYHSREDGNEIKNNKKTSNRRKATMPSISSSVEEAKQYMSQLIQNKEPQPSSYSDELYSYQASGITDMLYPTLEDTSSKNIQNENDDDIKMEEKKPEITEMPSFYKKNKVQQNSVTSALQKLTGSKTITQEGMMDISSSTDQPSMVSGGSGTISPPYMPTMPAFTMDQMNDNSSPIDYLKSSQSSQNMFSDYSSSYSKDNYVVPPNLSQYSYPIMMRPSTTAAASMMYPQELHEDMVGDKTQQILLEKINYMIYLLEQQKKEKSKHTTEEFVLYSFLGVFVIYLADSFARSGRYIR
jgi:hypothetical protein